MARTEAKPAAASGSTAPRRGALGFADEVFDNALEADEHARHAVVVVRQIAALAPGLHAQTFVLPPELVEPEELPMAQAVLKGADAAGTAFIRQ